MTTPPLPTPPPDAPSTVPVRGYQPVQYAEPSNFYQRAFNKIPAQARYANPGYQTPRLLANRQVVLGSWVIAMIIIGFDEWHNLHILPRPKRLWDTSLFYGLLTLFSVADAVVPIANAFAIGYTLTLLYQYYNGGITPSTGKAQSQGTTSASNQTGNLSPGTGIRNPTQILQPNPTPAPGA